VARAQERRPSPIQEVSYLFAEMVQHGLRCIAFCKTKKLCEMVLARTREILEETSVDLADSICVYRGGYVAEDRRKIEADLFGGKLRGVAATNALEFGIDAGHIAPRVSRKHRQLLAAGRAIWTEIEAIHCCLCWLRGCSGSVLHELPTEAVWQAG
jgi:DEAD/DEAH box helicase domain-containing protein